MTTLVLAGAVAKAWLGTLALLALQGTLLAGVALLLTRAGRLRPGWQAAIWLVVLARLALPWSPGMRWSLADLIARLSDPGGAAGGALAPRGATAAAAMHPWASLWLALATLWLAGAIVVLARAVRGHRHAAALARAAHPAPAAARELLASLAHRSGVRAPRLAVGDGAVGPYVLGALRPVVIVPAGLLEDRALLRGALLHELAHVRRRDGLARLLQRWIAALFYWWPVARFASRRLDLAREAACDAWALAAGELSPAAYARLLVQMATLPAAAAPALAAPHALHARIAAVLGPPARATLGPLHRLALAAWIVVALGGARSAEAREGHATCRYTPQLARALLAARPDADLDGDGTLSRAEVCELQAELRRHPDEVSSKNPDVSAELARLLADPLSCNYQPAEGLLPPLAPPEAASCHQVEGVDR